MYAVVKLLLSDTCQSDSSMDCCVEDVLICSLAGCTLVTLLLSDICQSYSYVDCCAEAVIVCWLAICTLW